MLRVRIEIVPFGDEAKKREITQIVIGQIDRTPDDVGTYSVKVYETKFNGGDPQMFEVDHFGITGHQRSKGAVELVRRALEIHQGIGVDEPGE